MFVNAYLLQKKSIYIVKCYYRIEGNSSFHDPDTIETKTREVLLAGGLAHVDVHRPACSLDSSLDVQQFDVLVSVFCLESACSSHEQYRNAMANMVS